jgi:Arc/MetJ family transcription regulator
MRTNIDIDDALLAAVMQATGQTTKKATVEMALRDVLEAHERMRAITESAGIGWDGDLEAMRTGRA